MYHLVGIWQKLKTGEPAEDGTASARSSGMDTNRKTYDLPLKVLICCPDRISANRIEHQARLSGHRPTCCMSQDRLLETALAQLPDCILVVHDPPASDGIALAGQLQDKFACGLVLAAAHWDKTLAKAANSAGYDAFLSIPATDASLHLALLKAEEGQKNIRHLKDQVAELEQRLAERKLIEKAKGLVMAQKQLNEEQAFRTMRSESMRRRISMARLAEELLTRPASLHQPH